MLCPCLGDREPGCSPYKALLMPSGYPLGVSKETPPTLGLEFMWKDFKMTRDGMTGKASQFMYFIMASPVKDSTGYSHMNCWENPTWPPVQYLGQLNPPGVASPAIHAKSIIYPPRNVSSCLLILPTNYIQRLSPSSDPSPWPQSFRMCWWDQDSGVYRTWPQRYQIQPCPFCLQRYVT